MQRQHLSQQLLLGRSRSSPHVIVQAVEQLWAAVERQRDRPVHRAALPDATPFAPLFATCCHSADSGTGRKCRAAGASITRGQKHKRPVRTQDRCAAPHWQNLPATHLKASQRGHQRAGMRVQCIGLKLVCVHCFFGEAHSAVHQFPAAGIVSKQNAAVSPVAGATTKAGQPSKAMAVHCTKQDLKTGLCIVPATPMRSLLQLSRAQLGEGLAKQPLKLKNFVFHQGLFRVRLLSESAKDLCARRAMLPSPCRPRRACAQAHRCQQQGADRSHKSPAVLAASELGVSRLAAAAAAASAMCVC